MQASQAGAGLSAMEAEGCMAGCELIISVFRKVITKNRKTGRKKS
jgi:hypothetical protein